MKKLNKGRFFVAIAPGSMKVFNFEKNRLVQSWFTLYEKQNRIFSMNGHYAVLTKGTKRPFGLITERFFHLAQFYLSKTNPRFFFDIVKDESSGVEIIELQPERTYDCKVAPELSSLPKNGIYSDQESSFFISLLAYKLCYDVCRNDPSLQKDADEYAKRYTALRQSTRNKMDNGTFVVSFGDIA